MRDSFPFSCNCIAPSSMAPYCQDENIPIVSKFVPGGKISREDAETIAPMGNSPTFLSMKQMRDMVPLWQNMSVAIFKDKEANEVRAGGRGDWGCRDGMCSMSHRENTATELKSKQTTFNSKECYKGE
eukprot:GHRQ01024665.1.p3 GENE.GHRQ01024665.1~~GHRQ01024665.1.p3  ORF type:complete len:128 (-),score=29.01 GHRQ01024665.1:719-1102(-)